ITEHRADVPTRNPLAVLPRGGAASTRAPTTGRGLTAVTNRVPGVVSWDPLGCRGCIPLSFGGASPFLGRGCIPLFIREGGRGCIPLFGTVPDPRRAALRLRLRAPQHLHRRGPVRRVDDDGRIHRRVALLALTGHRDDP